MKTSTFFSVLSLALIFAVATSAFAGGIGKISPNNTSVRYAVNVVYNGHDQQLLSTYVIKIFNERHQLAAPPQVLIPGQSQYVFFERGPADGVRIAVIEKAMIDSQVEPWWTLVTEPCVVKGPFEIGNTYRFDLYPKLQGERE